MKRIWLLGLVGLWLVGCAGTPVPPTAVSVAEIPSAATLADEAPTTIPGPTATVPAPASSPVPSPTNGGTMPPTPIEAVPTPSATPPAEPTVPALPGTELFSFTTGEPGWYIVNDDVMGGVSRSSVDIVNGDTLSFSGVMSLDNNGGFASVRSDWRLTDLSDADGVLLRVLGDGKVYRLRVRTAENGRDISYNALFETTPETWQTVYVPFASMVPTYRGFIMDVGQLDRATIGSFGLMLSDKQAGEFALMVDWIRAVSEEEIRTWNTDQAAPPS